MRKSIYQKLTRKESKKWEKEKEWEKNADFWIKIIRENLDPFRLVVTNRAILKSLKEEKKLRILDAGCGEGYLCRILAKKKHRVFGIDFCPKLIKAAKDLERKKPLGIKYFVGNFWKMDFPSSFFDVILSHQTINEIKNPEKAFKEFFRILKRGGRIVCLFLHPCFDIKTENLKNTPLSLVYFKKIKIKRGFYLVSGIKSPSSYFYLHLPLEDWLGYLEKTGFSIFKIKEPHPPLVLLKKGWWRKNFERPRFILIEARKSK